MSKKCANVLLHIGTFIATSFVWGTVAAGAGFMGVGFVIWALHLVGR